MGLLAARRPMLTIHALFDILTMLIVLIITTKEVRTIRVTITNLVMDIVEDIVVTIIDGYHQLRVV